jgi:type IV pilus assembly protein PilA
MFCPKCGVALAEGDQFCNHCGQPISVGAVPLAATPPPATPPVAVPPPDSPTSGKALASMISGIFGLVFFLPAIAAIILGHMSRSEIRRSNGRLKGNGMATAGLILGYGVFAIIPFILILAAIAIPNLLRARMAANEASALASVRSINTAEISYLSFYPAVGMTCRLASLGGSGTPHSADAAGLIDSQLASGQKHGYRFELANCVNAGTDHRYQIVAYPAVRNQTGTRTFCSDESAVIRVSEGESVQDCLKNGTPL